MEVRKEAGKCHYCKIMTLKTYNHCLACNVKTRIKKIKYEDEVTRDHVTPKSKGGKKTVRCCYACNKEKADQDYESFMKTKAADREYRKNRFSEKEAT